MTKLSENFSRPEFACRCGCGYDTVDAELLMVLQGLRDHFRARVRVLSGTRCNAHNATVDNASLSSLHMAAKAADISVSRVSPRVVQLYLEGKYPDQYGLGCYETFTHVDVRDRKARWTDQGTDSSTNDH